MKITKKILLAVLLPFVLVVTVGLLAIGTFFSLQFKQQEDKEKDYAIRRISEHMEKIENSFFEIANSLSAFGETYEVISKHTKKDILSDHIFYNLDINLLFFFNSEGNYIVGECCDEEIKGFESFGEDSISSFVDFICSDRYIGYINNGVNGKIKWTEFGK